MEGTAPRPVGDSREAGEAPALDGKLRAVEAMRVLSEEEREEVAASVLGTPSKGVVNRIWMAVVFAMVAVVLVSLGAVVYFVAINELDSAVISSVLTLTLGYLVGFLQPSPIADR